ncbi:tyrosine-protein kinase receptor UFO-like isoform X2 [Liolophura sinensis]
MILDSETQLTIYNLLIHPDKLEIGDKIGKGAFGTVYYGRYKPDDNPLHAKEVAVKTLKENCGYSDINGFMNEALVMSDFNHPNVLGLTGVCIQEDTDIPIIVLPYMEHGDLKTYLRHFRYDQDEADKAPDFPQLLGFCLHIARGMNYLAQMKFVHRDLAARNCMLDGNMVAKVADFGLTRDIYCSSYYRQDRNKLLPIKWMALESLQDRVFTTYSDIWSFAVTVWEILTLGKVPYPDLENYQILGYLENGDRLTKPDVCTDGLYQLMMNCWDENPKSRPPFLDIAKQLEDTLTGLCGYLDLGEDVTSSHVTATSRSAARAMYSNVSTDGQSYSSAELMLPRNPRSVYGDYREIGKK